MATCYACCCATHRGPTATCPSRSAIGAATPATRLLSRPDRTGWCAWPAPPTRCAGSRPTASGKSHGRITSPGAGGNHWLHQRTTGPEGPRSGFAVARGAYSRLSIAVHPETRKPGRTRSWIQLCLGSALAHRLSPNERSVRWYGGIWIMGTIPDGCWNSDFGHCSRSSATGCPVRTQDRTSGWRIVRSGHHAVARRSRMG